VAFSRFGWELFWLFLADFGTFWLLISLLMGNNCHILSGSDRPEFTAGINEYGLTI
jgi:hypothetical protein